MSSELMWHLYIRKGKAYVPRIVRTRAGVFIDSDPVEVIDISNFSDLVNALERVIGLGNDVIPDFDRASFPKPAVLKPAGVRSWSEFERGAVCFAVYLTDSGYKIPKVKELQDGGWEEDRSDALVFSRTATAQEVARALATKAINSSEK